MLRTLTLLSWAALWAVAFCLILVPYATAEQNACRIALAPGDEVAGALESAAAGESVCLGPGEYRPVTLTAAVSPGLTLRGVAGAVTIRAPNGVALDLAGARRLTVEDVIVRAPDAIGVRIGEASSTTLRRVRIEGAAVAVLLEGGSTARIEDTSVQRALDAGVIVRGGARLIAERLLLAEAETGVAVFADGSEAVVRESRISGGAGPAVFAGVPACAEGALGSTVAPACYHEQPTSNRGAALVALDGVVVEDGAGAGIVLHPGARAEVRRSRISGRALGGLFAWGASLSVSDSVFEANSGFGVELRAFPDAETAGGGPASALIERTTVRFTRPLGGGLLGDGVVVRRSSLRLVDSSVIANAGIGVAVRAGSAAEIAGTRLLDNEGAAVCVSDDATAVITDSPLTGNGADALARCAP